ncbi:MAG: hypothetical protein HFJ50_05775 [Clostridia bacterium]|jgi:predicted  nucleic acid-binding Zn-ribbon protein|nr:hypothetical protein [Clostridia bacterium]
MKDEQFEKLVGLIRDLKESLQGQINGLQEKVNGLECEMSGLKGQMGSLEGQVSGLRGEMNEKFAEMKKSQNEMEMRLSKAIYSVSEQLEEYERINRAQHGKMQDEMDKNYLRCEKERKKLEQGIDTLYTLYKDKEKLSKAYSD